MRGIILTRARKEGIKIEADDLDYLVEIGEKRDKERACGESVQTLCQCEEIR